MGGPRSPQPRCPPRCEARWEQAAPLRAAESRRVSAPLHPRGDRAKPAAWPGSLLHQVAPAAAPFLPQEAKELGGGGAGALDVCQQRCRHGGLRFRGDIMCGKRDTAWTPPSSPPPASSCALVAQGAVSPAGPGNGSGAWGRACTCAPLALLHHWPRRMRGTAKVCHPPGAPRAGSALPLCTSNKGTHGSSLGCPQTQPLAGKGWLLPSFICRP